MSVACRKIYEPSFRKDVYPVSVFQLISHDIIAHGRTLNSHLLKTGNIDLYVEMARVAADRAVLHPEEIALSYNIVAARNGDKEITA